MTSPGRRKITNVVFDIGNVLIEWDPRHLYRRIFETPAEIEHFLSTVCTSAWNLELDRGRPFAEGIAELVELHPEHEAAIRAFDERWGEMVPGPVRGTLSLMERLEENGVGLYAITNFSREKFAEARRRFPFFDRFRGVIVSAHERLLKPDRRIFDLLVSRYGLRAEECLFIDDMPANVAGARAAGMAAHHFKDAAGLERALVEYRASLTGPSREQNLGELDGRRSFGPPNPARDPDVHSLDGARIAPTNLGAPTTKAA